VHFLLQTDEQDWIYKVKGSRPEYKPPVAPARINSKLRYGRLKGVSTFRQIITRRTPRGVLLVMIEQRATQKLFDSCLSLVSNFCESFIFEHLTFRHVFLELSTEHGLLRELSGDIGFPSRMHFDAFSKPGPLFYDI
jgi:hypothetical protein